MSNQAKILNTGFIQFSILNQLLYHGPQTGSTLLHSLQKVTGRDISDGQLYITLNRLIKSGDIEAAETIDRTWRQHNITAAGKKKLEDIETILAKIGYDKK